MYCAAFTSDCRNSFCYYYNRVGFAFLQSVDDGVTDTMNVERNFRKQDDVASSRHTGVKGNPSRLVAHDFNHHDTLVGTGGGVQAVNGIGGYRYGRIEAKRNIGSPHVIVDGLGNAYHIHSRFSQFCSCFLRTVSSDAHDAVQAAFADGLKHDGRFVFRYGTRFSFEWFFA